MTKNYSEISKRITLLQNKHDANIICIEMKENLVFIDSSRSYDTARDFRKEMEKRFNKETSCLLITHYHFDHYGGVSAFKDVEIIAAENNFNQFFTDINYHLTKTRRKIYVNKWKKEVEEQELEVPESRKIHWKYYSHAELYPPSRIVTDEIQIGDDEEKIVFKVTGGHSKCSAYVFVPSEKTIIIGDNIAIDPEKGENGSLAYPMEFYRLGLNQKTIEVLKKIEDLPIETVISGHGPAVSISYVTKIRNYFESLFETMKKLYREGKNSEEILNSKQLEKHYDKQMENWREIVKRQYNTVIKDEIEKELDENKIKMLIAICSRKLEEYLSVYLDNAQFLFTNGYAIEGKGEYKDNFLGFNSVIKQEYKTEQYTILKDKVVELGTYTASYEKEQELLNYERKYLYSWIKENGIWMIKSDMTISEKVNLES